MKVTKKDAFQNLRKDFEMLRNGSWIPDNDSIDASLQMLDIIEEDNPVAQTRNSKAVETDNEQPKCPCGSKDCYCVKNNL